MMDKVNQDYEKQLSLWEKASISNDTQLTIQCLELCPSGYFFQLAELRLDQLLSSEGEKKILASSSASNPFSKGTASGILKHTIGDTYSFEKKDVFTGTVEESYSETVTGIKDGQIFFDNGARVKDLLGNDLVPRSGRFLSPAQNYSYQYCLGEKWTTRYGWVKLNGTRAIVQIDFKIVDRQELSTSAGTFNAFIAEGSGYDEQEGTKFQMKYWIDPVKCKRAVKVENFNRTRRGRIAAHNEVILNSYQESKKA